MELLKQEEVAKGLSEVRALLIAEQRAVHKVDYVVNWDETYSPKS
jgi:hypothetical protein